MTPRPRSISIAVLALGLTAAACGGGRSDAPLPSDPEGAVRAFLSAVRENSLVAMGGLWGSPSRGPASGYMDRQTLEQRLTVIRIYLQHDRSQILPPDETVLQGAREREIRVRLERNGCRPVVPFTVVRWRDGWLVSNVDIAAAGNPERPCPPDGEIQPPARPRATR